jgi:hypothetical protein
MGQGPTKNPIVCLASDSRHWGLKIFDRCPRASRINGLFVAKDMVEIAAANQSRRRFDRS